MDKDKSKFLTADELVQVVRPTSTGADNGIQKARQIVTEIDNNRDGQISKAEFVQYLMPMQKKRILDAEDEMEDLRRMFKEQVKQGVSIDPEAENEEDPLSMSQFLTKEGVKALIQKVGHATVTNEEIDAIFDEMDENGNGLIDRKI